MRRHFSLIARLCVLWLTYAGSIQAADWPRFRGEGLAATSEEAVLTHWPTNGPAVVWQANRIDSTTTTSGGYGSFAVAQGVAYVLTSGKCLALNADTGQNIWVQKAANHGYSTPAVAEGRVYVYGNGLQCLDAATGKKLWETQDYSFEGAQSPWVEDGRVFISQSEFRTDSTTGCLKAYDASNGMLLWRSQSNYANYSSPVGATIHGIRQIIFPGMQGLVAVDPATGTEQWHYRAKNSYGGPSPVVCGDIIFTLQQGLRIQLTNDHFTSSLIWSNPAPSTMYDTAVCYQQCLYLASGTNLFCLELETGHVNWKQNMVKTLGSIFTVTLAQDKLVLLGGDSRIVLAQANPEKYEEIACSPAASRTDRNYVGAVYNSPALADGRLYYRGTSGLRCVNLDPRPALALAAACSDGATQGQLVISNRNGTAITASQATNIDLFCSPNPALPMAQWECRSPALRLTNGVLKFFESAELAYPSRFYRATETTHP